MAAAPAIDARMQAALARLTDNEKECLRRRLRQQTAKEMARELGVSPHAVEKRLKMARTKLGLSSSLEAARLLAAAEEYRPTASGVPAQAVSAHSRARVSLVVRTCAVVAALSAVLLVQSSGDEAHAGSSRLPDARTVDGFNWDRIPPEDMAGFLTDAFARLDRNGSGYIEQLEVPGDGSRAGRRKWIAVNDRDDDRRVSLAEYRRAADEGNGWRLVAPGRVAATRAEITAIGQATFQRLDADGSGSLEGMESPDTATRSRPYSRGGEAGEPGWTIEQTQEEARAEFYRWADKDADRRVSVPELYRWMAMHLAGGIPAQARASLRRLVPPEG